MAPPVRRVPNAETSVVPGAQPMAAIDTTPCPAPGDVPIESPIPFEPLEPPEAFRKALNTWYRKHARQLPWRGIRNPYATWLSEIMLQQTRVATVLERYEQFLQRFPTIAALAAAPEDAVLALWSGLGYYRRARMLHRGAQFVDRELNGELPHTATELRTLPGVGEYTAAAIASIAFGQSIAVLDGNVERVLVRLLGVAESRSAETRARLLRVANDLVPSTPARRGQSNPPGDHNQSMMELGATLCLPRSPLCLQCPVMAFCHTRGEHPTVPRKALRSRRSAYLLATRKRGTRTEVLLERRPPQASLMPGMLELPPLPMEAVDRREPILRLRHSITDTNYYVEIFAEAATDATDAEADSGEPSGEDQMELLDLASRVYAAPDEHDPVGNEDEAVYIAAPGELDRGFSLRSQVPANASDLHWVLTRRLPGLPLTGLARKALQRLGVMGVQQVQISRSGSG